MQGLIDALLANEASTIVEPSTSTEVRRINRMGGKIVNIESLNTEPETESSER